MEKKETINANGYKTSKNWMLDEIIASFEKHYNYTPSNEDLINELAIQKIEYGRICLMQILAKRSDLSKSIKDDWEKLDTELKNRINELGGKPTNFS
jgi:hypothetical protein